MAAVDLTFNAIQVLKNRYLLKDKKGKIIETPEGLFRRVARAVAKIDKKYKQNPKKSEKEFYEVMFNKEFLPNSPTLMNAGTPLSQLSACFVLPIEDDLVSIMDSVKYMAIIHKSGGGTGFDFSKLRPTGDIVFSTKGIASGPVSFMKIHDVSTEVVKQGGKRRGANMGVLDTIHPDILTFINAKSNEGELKNFNISVKITNAFMNKVTKNQSYNLVNPRTKKVVGKLNAKKVFDSIIQSAWKTGDPGLVFIDEINRRNPTPALGKIESTNPCGEQPLYSYESCNLGSINLAKFIKNKKVDWSRLKRVVSIAVHFLDNVIDTNKYPLPRIEKMTKANRKIGLGVMGFAELLIQLNLPYDSKQAVAFAEKLMKFISTQAREASINLAKTRGSFPNFKKSIWAKKYKRIRNATLTTIAPTGTISIIAGCSSGIEPLFAVSYMRDVLDGTKLIETNPYFEKIAKEHSLYSKEIMNKIAMTGSVRGIKKIPLNLKRLFQTALEIKPEWHVRLQAAFQKYTDNAVSKTINFPKTAKTSEVRKAFLLAWKLKCKGITVYRYGSKPEQVLYVGTTIKRRKGKPVKYISAESDYAGGCPYPYCPH
jgi:ribonucleoside-diphosphate reductase alpha chain